MFKVKVTARASDSIDEIEAWLQPFTDVSDIDKVIDKINDAIASLADMPTRHLLYRPTRPIRRPVRYAKAGKFNVYFTIYEDSEQVDVLDVIHRRRSPAFVRRRLA